MANANLPPYFQKYLDEKFESISVQLAEIHLILQGNGKKGLVDEVLDLKNWRDTLTARWSVIVGIMGIVSVALFEVVKEVMADYIKK